PLQLLLQLPAAVQDLVELDLDILGADLEQPRHPLQPRRFLGNPLQRAFARHGLDTADAGGNAAFRNDLEETDIAGAADVGAAAQLGGELAELEHPYRIAVLLAEQRHGAAVDGLVVTHMLDMGGRIGADLLVHQPLDLGQLLGPDRLEMREVEAQPVGRDQRALLGDVGAQHRAQHGMQQMSGRMVQHGGLPGSGVDPRRHRLALSQPALAQSPEVAVGIAVFDGVLDLELDAVGQQQPPVADLAAGLGIERRAFQHHHAALAGFQRADAAAVAVEADDLALVFQLLVAGEFGAAGHRAGGDVFALELAGRAGALPLRLHLALEAGHVEAQAPLAGNVVGEIDREPVGVVQLEHHFARNGLALEVAQRLVEQLDALLEGLAETLFLLPEHALDLLLG